MLVDVRPTRRLRGSSPVDVSAALGPIVEALGQDTVDLSRLRVVCDWVQYKHNFRDVIDIRPIMGNASSEMGLEAAVDLRRCAGTDLSAATATALREFHDPGSADRTYLEPWTAGKDSCIWDFNSLYWQALGRWEEVSGKDYEQALPGGSSDGRNQDAARELILELFDTWDELARLSSLPEQLYVVELGVGNGGQAKTWLDEFRELALIRGVDYYQRLHYIMGDYSPHVLKLAQDAVAEHSGQVSSIVVDATDPTASLGFLRHKAFLVYISNVYDNLPTDEVASISGRTYRVEVRAYVPREGTLALAEMLSSSPDQVGAVVGKLLRLGPELLAEALPGQLPDVPSAVRFWQEAWSWLRLEERYVPLEGLDLYQICPSVTGEALRPILEDRGDLRMQVSNGAVASFVETLRLLHPYGRLHCHDLFVTDARRYDSHFCGPGKYDGSIVNWVNGALVQYIGNRRGFEVNYSPFRHREGTNITTLTAHVRE